MGLETIMGYDASGGGTLAAVTGAPDMTIKDDGFLVGYFYDGISAEDVVVTNPNNPRWEAAGFKLPATSDGTAVGAGDPNRWLTHKVPVKQNDTIVLTGTSGANPVHAGIHVYYPRLGAGMFEPRKVLDGEGNLVTKGTTAGGTNCAAGTLVAGATKVGDFGGDGRVYTPVEVKANAAFTTTAFLGIRKMGGDNLIFITPVGLTDVANDMKQNLLPKGLFTCTQQSKIEVFWASVTAEQPTADLTFVY